ncbi:carboxymuconolactone decarboxylase family protein [Niveibacterium terrae]|uniref:carboxymuconolactone decarboxylase family protein n=1 Tax=Niveibacterium terrae TaxID=3373598 RepID=UPI003A8CF011
MTPSPASRPTFAAAPKLAQLTREVLFGDIWTRPILTPRERSLITVAALVALCRSEQLPIHFAKALENGVSREELIEAITHLAFYSGWPSAHTAIGQLDGLDGSKPCADKEGL